MIQTAKTIRNGNVQQKQRAARTSAVVGTQHQGNTLASVISEFLGKDDELSLAPIYEDMYYHDPILGTGVDLQSTVPFSDITLSGGDDEKLAPFYASIERTNIMRRMPDMSVDILRYGRFLGSFLFEANDKVFSDLIAYSSKDAVIKQVPLTGVDPLIIIKNPEYVKDFATENYEYFVSLRELLPDSVIETFREEAIELDPTTSIFLPRHSGPNSIGVSVFKRVLPLYIMEKTLLKGTITEATRRQRAITHIEVGDGEEWIPSAEDLAEVIELFQETDNDPVSSIVATRSGVNVNEVKAGGDFWKVTDVWSDTEQMKFRAMGISEMFFSGDYSIERSESAISVYLEGLSAHRTMITSKLLKEKLFPLISAVHGFTNTQTANAVDFKKFFSHLRKHDQFLIPDVHWVKDLKPKYDNQRVDILDTLLEKGMPVTWAMYASATGMNLSELENDLAEDIETKKRIFKLLESMPKNPNDELASVQLSRLKKFMANATDKPNLLKRLDTFSDNDKEIKGLTRTGKYKRVNQQIAKAKALKDFTKTLKNLEDPSNHLDALKRGKHGL